jgi:hypothetical protein
MELLDHDIEELAEAGLFRNMQADTSLNYQLNRLTKAELTEIRQYLGVKGISKLSKQRQAEALAQAIMEKLPVQLQLFDELTYDDLQALLKKKGLLKDFTDIPVSILVLLRRMGLAFTGILENQGLVLVMPRELLQPCRQLLSDVALRKTILYNQKVLLVCRGLVAYYGVIPVDELRQMLETMDLATTEPQFSTMLKTIGVSNGYLDCANDFVCDKRVIYVDEVLSSHLAMQEHGYYPVSLEKALLAAQQIYVDWTDAHRELFDYLIDEQAMDEEAAAEELMFLIFALNNRVPIPSLLQRLEERQVKLQDFAETIEFLTLLDKAYQQTRLWGYRGFTPTEIQELDSRPRLRVLPPLPSRSVKNGDSSLS